ncbi:hypothetical protein [Sphingobium yanoikuyae]|uniref:hypothetical protein n=1 Tax=Sphingobium yanoikuyae TaxID=13690 RepID=UPI0026EC202D|nr:hypothetical protein [Sphingobium yanoikuyae]
MSKQEVMERKRTAADILGGAAQARGNGKSQATTVEQSRAIAEVQGALIVAQNRPRDKAHALNEALEACRTREVAENAFFKFPRGGQSVSGETIHLARELARCWGNIDYTISELNRDDDAGHSEMLARAWDLETNARASLTFIVPHLRDKKGGPERLTDVRDIYENNANMGARRLRECIFAVLPKYLVQAASDECRNTLETRNAETPLPKRVADALAAFAKIGIDKTRIEAKLGQTANFTAVDLANLQISYKSIVRNEISADDEFPRLDGAPATSKLDALEQAVTGGEGPDQTQQGEQHNGSAFDAAVAEIDRCPTADAIDSALARLRPMMETNEDADDLFSHAETVKARKWGNK